MIDLKLHPKFRKFSFNTWGLFDKREFDTLYQAKHAQRVFKNTPKFETARAKGKLIVKIGLNGKHLVQLVPHALNACEYIRKDLGGVWKTT